MGAEARASSAGRASWPGPPARRDPARALARSPNWLVQPPAQRRQARHRARHMAHITILAPRPIPRSTRRQCVCKACYCCICSRRQTMPGRPGGRLGAAFYSPSAGRAGAGAGRLRARSSQPLAGLPSCTPPGPRRAGRARSAPSWLSRLPHFPPPSLPPLGLEVSALSTSAASELTGAALGQAVQCPPPRYSSCMPCQPV